MATGSAGRPGVELFPRLYPSQLEPRIVLNAAPIAQLDPSGVLVVDAGDFANDGNTDTFEVHLSEEAEGTLNVTVNDTVVYTGAIDDVRGIRIEGSGDTDLLALDAAVLDRVEVSFEPGGAAENRDTVQLTASHGNSWQAVSVDLCSAGGEIQLTRNDGVVSAGLSFTGTVDVIDSLAVADRTLATGDLTSVIITGQDGVLEVQSDTGTLKFTQGDQANWNIDATGGDLRFEGDLEALSLNARAENITVVGTFIASAGAMSFEANDQFQLDAPARLITSTNTITIHAEDITLAGAIEASDGGDVFATAAEEGTLRVSGLIDASDNRLGGTGGQVHLDGGEVILTGSAEVNVSGTNGGGQIHIGSPTTLQTVVDSEVFLIADATQSGDGGTIILWSDDTTQLAGTLTARGGTSSGNGGSVELSGKQRVRFEGQIDVSASHDQPSGGDIQLTAEQIEIAGELSTSGSGTILLQGAVLLIGDTSLSVEDGNLKVTGAIDGSHALMLTADTGEIALHGPVGSAQALASLTVQSAGTVSFATMVITTGDQQITAETVHTAALHQTNNAKLTISGDLALQTNTVLNTDSGDLTLGAIVGGGHDLQLISGTGTTTVTGPATGIGELTLQQNSPEATGAVSFEGALAVEAIITFAQDYSVSLTGDSTTVTQAVTFINTGGVLLGNGANELNFSGGLTNTASTTALNGVLLTNHQSITLSDLLIIGDSEINTVGGDLEIKNSLNSSGDGLTSHHHDLTINAGGGNVLLNTIGNAADGVLGDLLINGEGNLNVGGTITTGGTLTLQGDNIHLFADIHSAGAVSITAANALTLGGDLDAGSQKIVLRANQNHEGDTGFTQSAGTTIRTSSDAEDAITVSVGGSGDVSLARIEATAGGVVINAGGQITDGATPEVSIHAKTLTVTAATGIDLKTEIDAFHGNITGSGILQLDEADALEILSVVLAGGDASIAADTLVVGTITTSGSVALTARTGAITDGNGDQLNITAESLSLSSVNGIELDTRVGTINLTVSGTGDVQLQQAARSLVVTNLDVADGDVILESDAALSLYNLSIPSHSLTVSGTDVTFNNTLQGLSDATVTATGDVVFLATIDFAGPLEVNAAGDVTFHHTITLGGGFGVSGDTVTLAQSLATGGGVEISARNELSLGAGIDAGSATISLHANQDGNGSQGLVLLSGAIKTFNTDADALLIDVKGSGNVRVDAIDVGGGVIIHAGGVLRGWEHLTADIQAATLQMITGRGIDVLTTAAEVTAEVTQVGGIRLVATGAVTAERLVTHDGSIDFVSGDTMQLGKVTAGAGGDVTLTAQQGSILALPGGPDASLVSADLLTLSAPADITLWTDANILSAAISGSGTLTIHNQDALTIDGATVHDGDAVLTASSFVISATALGSATPEGLAGLDDADGNALHAVGVFSVSAMNLILEAVDGSIVIDANTLADGVDLIVTAATEIIVNGPLQASGGNITLTAGQIELNGAISTSGSGAILLQGAVLLTDDSSLSVHDGDLKVVGTVDGSYAFTLMANTGEIFLQGPLGSTVALASLIVQSASTVRFATTVNTTGDQQITAETVRAAALHQADNAKITIAGELVLQAGTVLNSGGGDLSLEAVVGGGHDLQLISGAGTTTVTGPATGIGELVLQQNLPTATGAVSFEGDLAATSLITFAQGYSVSLTGDSITMTDAVTFQNTGGVILGDGASELNFSGGLTNTASTTTLHGTLLTNHQHIILDDLLLAGDSVIDTAGGNLTLGSIVGGGSDLQLISGAGTTTVTGAATGIGELVLQQNLPTATGAVSFEGDLAATSLITFAQGYSVSLTGDSITMTDAVTFQNTGGVILGDGASELNFSGGLTNTASTTTLHGTLLTNHQHIILDDLLLAGDSVIDTAGGNLTLGSIVGGGRDLQLISGAGTTTVTGAATGIGELILQQNLPTATGAVSFEGDLAVATLKTFSQNHSVSLTGASITVAHAVTFNNTAGVTLGGGASELNFSGGLTSTAGTTTLSGTLLTHSQQINLSDLMVAGDSVIDTSGGDLQINGALNSSGDGVTSHHHDLSIDAGGGDALFLAAIGAGADGALGTFQVTAKTIQLANIGTAAAAGVGGQSVFTADDGVTMTGAVIHTTGSLRFAGPLMIDTSGDLLIMTTGGGTDDRIVFTGNVGHVAGWTHDLTVHTQGASEIVFDAAISVADNLLIDAAGDLTVGGMITTGGTLTLLGDNIHLHADILSTGAVSVTAANALNLGGDLNASDQTILLRANQDGSENQGFYQADSTTIQTTHHASDAIQIIVGGSGSATLATLIASAGGVQISAGDQILGGVAAVGPEGKAVNITTNDLVLESGASIALTTNVLTLNATVAAHGDLHIGQSIRDLTVTNLALSAGNATLDSDAAIVLQNLDLPAHALTINATDVLFELPVSNLQDLTVEAQGNVDFLQALTASGTVFVHTSGDITFHGEVTLGGGLDISGDAVTLTHDLTTGGAIRISALNELRLDGNVGAGTATIVLRANQDGDGMTGFSQAAGTIIRTNSDAEDAITVSVGGSGDVSLARIEATAGGVVINAGGQITDGATPEASIHAKSLTVTAATGIDLKTDIEAFSGNITGSGTLQLVDADALEILSVVLAGGDASISADTLVVGTIVTSGSVALTVRTGAITDGNGDQLNITAESLSLSSVNGIELDTRVGTIDLTVSGTGDVHLQQAARSLVVTNLDVADGDVVLESDAALSLHNLSVPSHSLTVSATDITFNNTLQGLSDATVTATGDVVFLATIDFAGPLEVNAAGDVTFHHTITLGGGFEVSGNAVTLAQSLATGSAIRISALNELSLGADVDAGSETISLHANQDNKDSQGLVLLSGAIKTFNTDADALVIDVKGSGDVRIDAIDVGGGVIIHAGGVLRGWEHVTADIQAATLQMITGRGIDVLTTAAEVTAEVTQVGGIRLVATGAVTAERLVTHDGSIDFVSGDTMQLGKVTAGAGGDVTLTAQQGSILALPGGPDASLVSADLLTLTAPADITLWTNTNTLLATLSGTGSLTVHNQGALTIASASVHDGDATITGTSLVVGSITAPGSVALTASSGGIIGSGGITHLTTRELILMSAGEIDVRTNIDFLSATIFEQGNLRITDIGQLQVNLINLSSGHIAIEAFEALVVTGGVATEQGAIRLVSVNGDLQFVNSVANSILLVYSGGDHARIEGIAGTEVIITGPGFVIFRTPQSQYFTVRPDLHADAPNIPTLGNVQVDHEGWATLVISFGAPIGPEELYFRLVINWGDSVQTITAANSEGNLIPLQRAGEGGLPFLYKIQHQYLNNPNPQDPAAPIPISIVASNSLIDGGPADIAFFADGNATDPLFTQVDLVLNVPGTGLSITAVPVIPAATQERPAEPEQPLVDPPASTVIPDSSRSVQPLVMASQTSAVYERYYVLRIVVQIDEEGNTRELADIRIDDDYLRNLPKLFELLPDDRYRLYQIREDGVAQLITDVIIRGGKSAGTLDLDEGLEQLDEQGSNLDSLPSPGPSRDGTPANALDGQPVIPDLQSSWQDASPVDFLVLTKTGIVIGETAPNTMIGGDGIATPPYRLASGDSASLPLAVQVQLARR